MSIIQDKSEVREYLIMLVAICSQSINSKHVSHFSNKLFLVLIALCIYLPSFFYNCHIAFRLNENKDKIQKICGSYVYRYIVRV